MNIDQEFQFKNSSKIIKFGLSSYLGVEAKLNLLKIFASLPPEKQNSAFRDNYYTPLFDKGIRLPYVCLEGSVLLLLCIEYEHILCWCDHIYQCEPACGINVE